MLIVLVVVDFSHDLLQYLVNALSPRNCNDLYDIYWNLLTSIKVNSQNVKNSSWLDNSKTDMELNILEELGTKFDIYL